MALNQSLLPELEHELAGTRRALERVPFERAEWRPHPRSWTVVRLASHLANLPSWMKLTLSTEVLDLDTMDRAAVNRAAGSQAELLAAFDRNAAEAKAALAAASDATLLGNWSLASGGRTHFTMPRIAAVRAFMMNHSVHHRGQLTVYLRLLDVPVPALYGPSADEQGM